MKTFNNYSKIYLYFFIAIVILIRILLWHSTIKNDYITICDTLFGKELSYTLKVCDMPVENASGISFEAKILSKSKLANNLQVQIKNGEKLNISYGDTITLRGVIEIPEDEMNPGNFDYRGYLKSQGICAVLKSDIILVKDIKESKLKSFYAIRSILSKQIFKYLPYEEASLVNALVTGSKNELPLNIENSFKHSGIYHIVAVSGLHLNMFVLFMSYFYTKIRAKKKKKQFIIVLATSASVIFMLMFTGYGISVKRAAIMAVMLALAQLLNREYSAKHSLFTAMAIILLAEPFAYMDVAFQLSFLSTLGIIIGANVIQKYNLDQTKTAFISNNLIITGFAWIFTFPITVNAFHAVSLVTLISNTIIIPFVPILLAFSYVFALVCVFSVPSITQIASLFTVVPAKAVIFLSELFSKIPGAYISVSTKGLFLLIGECALIYLLARTFVNKHKNAMCIIMSLIIIANSSFIVYNKKSSKCQIHFVNVGQGECAIIQTPGGKNVLIDCGSDSVNDVYNNNVLPYMNYECIKHFDLAFVSHYHNDHINGIIPMIEDGLIKTLILPDRIVANDEKKNAHDIIKSALQNKVKIVFLAEGDSFDADKVSEFKIINPPKTTKTDANNASGVIKFTCNDTKILFAADIAENSQYALLEKDIKADILKVPHHGGYSAMSDKFAKAVNSNYAVISCGVDNMYSHPSDKTIQAYSDAVILRTDINKTIKFIIYKDHIRYFTYE